MISKRIIRKIAGEECWRFCMWYYHSFGLINLPLGFFRFLLNKSLVRVKIDDIHYVFVRPGTTDMDVFSEIFINKELNVDFGNPEFIIDAGAHVGFSAISLAILYPKAKILAVEPEAANFELLCKNTRKYDNISCINAGLWSHNAKLEIKDRECDNWNFIVSEVESPGVNSIEALSITEILKRYKRNRIDVLKMDIEGSEIEVLSTSIEWMNSVGVLVIELHDRFRSGCKSALENAIMPFSFEIESVGEKQILRNKSRNTSIALRILNQYALNSNLR